MQQYFTNQQKIFFEPLMAPTDFVPQPIVFIDHEFHQFWENKFLKENYPSFCGRDTILNLLEGQDIPSLLLSMQSQPGCLSLDSLLPMSSVRLTFTPAYSMENIFIGATVHLALNSLRVMNHDASQPQKMNKNFRVAMLDPITAMFSGIETMARRLEIDDTESCEELLLDMHHHCYHLLKSCNLLSEYWNYVNGLSSLNLSRICLNPYLDGLFRSVSMIAQKNNFTLTWSLAQEEISFSLDTDKFIILLASLVSNSVGFFEKDSTQENKIHIDVSVSKHSVKFTVSDNGIGISPDVLPHIFEPYFTCDRRDLQFSHIGLGLPLCQMIVRHHQGEISVVSNDGEGTVVTFTLSRELVKEDGQLIFSDNCLDYVDNRFSPLYTYLSDVCPKPYI